MGTVCSLSLSKVKENKINTQNMPEKLNINQVSSLLNRSTKSIRNYLKAGHIKAEKVNSKHGLEYIFDLNEVRRFAQDYLKLALTDQNFKSVQKKKGTSKVASKALSKETVSANDFAAKLIQLEAEKRKMIEDYAEYKSQLAFKMGQMEAKLKLLDSAKEEKERLAKQLVEREAAIQNLEKMRAFYEQRPWFLFWKTYKLAENEQVKVSK